MSTVLPRLTSKYFLNQPAAPRRPPAFWPPSRNLPSPPLLPAHSSPLLPTGVLPVAGSAYLSWLGPWVPGPAVPLPAAGSTPALCASPLGGPHKSVGQGLRV